MCIRDSLISCSVTPALVLFRFAPLGDDRRRGDGAILFEVVQNEIDGRCVEVPCANEIDNAMRATVVRARESKLHRR